MNLGVCGTLRDIDRYGPRIGTSNLHNINGSKQKSFMSNRHRRWSLLRCLVP